jgi:LysM repeat protein
MVRKNSSGYVLNEPPWGILRAARLKIVFTAATAFGLVTPSLLHSFEIIRCDNWAELVAKHEGRIALRTADPTLDFEAVLASAKATLDADAGKRTANRPLSASRSQKTKLPSNPAPSSNCKYVVRAGDTLSKIAKQTLGGAGRYKEILALNSGTLKSPEQLKIGQTLTLPCVEQSTQQSPSKVMPAKPSPPPLPVWTARRGESLEAVLKRWAKKSGYKVTVQTDREWILAVPVSIQGEFTKAVQELVKGLAAGSSSPPVRIYKNKTIKLG